MYGNHPMGTYHKSELRHARKRASVKYWRTTDGRKHDVTVTRILPAGGVA